jgi:hypothetical protein
MGFLIIEPYTELIESPRCQNWAEKRPLKQGVKPEDRPQSGETEFE